MHYLYKITCLINQKLYIGQTISPSARWRDHRSASSNPKTPLHHAMKKHGSHNFEFEIIATCRTQDDANFLETELVKQYDTYIFNNNGYNATLGGSNAPMSKEHKQNLSKLAKKRFQENPQYLIDLKNAKKNSINLLKEQNLPIPGTFKPGHEVKKEWAQAISKANSGRIVSEEENIKKSNSLLEFYKKNESKNKGKILTENHKQNISKSLIGKKRTEEQKQKLKTVKNSGRFKKGIVPWNKKITNEQEIEIRKLYKSGISMRKLARNFNIDRSSIKRIVSGN